MNEDEEMNFGGGFEALWAMIVVNVRLFFFFWLMARWRFCLFWLLKERKGKKRKGYIV